jgi:hypothetical protein
MKQTRLATPSGLGKYRKALRCLLINTGIQLDGPTHFDSLYNMVAYDSI